MTNILIVHPDDPDIAAHDGARQVNDRLVRTLAEHFSVRRAWPASSHEWASRVLGQIGQSVATRFTNVDDLVTAAQVDLLVACHSYFPEVMAAAKTRWGAGNVLLLHSLKAESVVHERMAARAVSVLFDEDDAKRKLALERASLGNADQIVVVSSSLRRELATHFGLEARVVLNPFEIEWYEGRNLPELPLNELGFALVGRPDLRKGIHLGIEAVQQVRSNTGLEVHLYLAGSFDGRRTRSNGHNRAYLEMLHAVRDLPWIHDLGVLPPKGVRSLFEETHGALVPSLYDAFGYVAAEALAFSPRPIISARGGPLELRELFGRGVVTEPSVPELAQVVREVIDAPTNGPRGRPPQLAVERWEAQWTEVVRNALSGRMPSSMKPDSRASGDSAQITLAEFREARAEINHFQKATSAMVFGALAFYVAAAGFTLKFLTDLPQEQLSYLMQLDLLALGAAVFVTLNAVLTATFIGFSFSVLRASRFIHEVLRPRLAAHAMDPLGFEAYYGASRITLFAEAVPVLLFLGLIHGSSWAAVALVWLGERHTGIGVASLVWATALQVAIFLWVAVWAYFQAAKGKTTRVESSGRESGASPN